MKATLQKLKKLKTKQVYGFKKDNFGGMNVGNDPTTNTTIITTTMTQVIYRA
ncbi:hypothetical protein [Mucilaginibacter sp. L196]|uniref:hypothetical protein n=1 Tax=Mucilaginibacter sp. L196 TaxID=1641870 RepID=UPI00131B4610|nr:hypothetical protein [Mucilaginibacter sp. L196]